MDITDSFRIALIAILTNRLRTVLTMLGIIIGVGAVIGLISLGRGVEAYVANEFLSLGSNLLTVRSIRPESNTRTRIEPLTLNDVEALSNNADYPLIQQVGAEYTVLGFIADEGENLSVNVSGMTPNMSDIQNWNVARGSYITDEHVSSKSRVAVLGVNVVEDLYGDSLTEIDPIGRIILINEQAFTVIGVMEELSGSFNNENDSIIVPISTAQTRLNDARYGGTYTVNRILVESLSEETVDLVERDVNQYFFESHRIDFDGEQDYSITNQSDILDAVGAITGLLTIFLSLIASVSLLVGGIGIMNIMLVSVTERTREIGLRKAVGAQPRDILMQFLIESVVLSIFGGALGVAFGWLIGVIGSALVPELPLSVGVDAIILATVVSTVIGVGFGLFPANRAARMHPIDALRFE
jgi:putative ABC transport system permease protein